MFRWEPEGFYDCTNSMAITPFWISTKHYTQQSCPSGFLLTILCLKQSILLSQKFDHWWLKGWIFYFLQRPIKNITNLMNCLANCCEKWYFLILHAGFCMSGDMQNLMPERYMLSLRSRLYFVIYWCFLGRDIEIVSSISKRLFTSRAFRRKASWDIRLAGSHGQGWKRKGIRAIRFDTYTLSLEYLIKI